MFVFLSVEDQCEPRGPGTTCTYVLNQASDTAATTTTTAGEPTRSTGASIR